MIKNKDILDWLQRVLRKETRGNVISMRDFNTYLAFAQRLRFDWLKQQMELTGRIMRSLETYQTTEVFSPDDETEYGEYSLSALGGVEKPLRCMAMYDGKYVKCDWVTQLELEERLSNSLTFPTAKHPVYVLEGGVIQLYPCPTSAKMTYIKIPEKAYLDWIVQSGRTVRYLSEGGSVNVGEGETYPNSVNNTTDAPLTREMKWSQEDTVAVANMILRNIAPSIADQGAYQFSSEESAKSERL